MLSQEWKLSTRIFLQNEQNQEKINVELKIQKVMSSTDDQEQRFQKLHEMGFTFDEQDELFSFGHLMISKWEVISLPDEQFNAKILDFQNVLEE